VSTRDAAEPLAGWSRGRDRRARAADAAPATRGDRQPPRTAGLETPTEHSLVRRLLRRYSRARGTAVRKKEPLLIEQLPAILMAMPDDELATRDRALLLLGYAGAFRRSELVALDVEQLRFSRAGATSG